LGRSPHGLGESSGKARSKVSGTTVVLTLVVASLFALAAVFGVQTFGAKPPDPSPPFGKVDKGSRPGTGDEGQAPKEADKRESFFGYYSPRTTTAALTSTTVGRTRPTTNIEETTITSSEINVSGFKKGRVVDVNLQLKNLTHVSPADVDVLLVGPGGKNAIVMSDVGTAAVNNITLVLDDEAASPLPATLVGGTFQPTNNMVGDTFPAPAPTPSGGSTLSVFDGGKANGVWNLYVFDAAAAGGQFAGGWSLEIEAKVEKR
jgi:hypothetical protein